MEPIFKKEPYSELVPQVKITLKNGDEVHLLDAGHRAADAVIRFSKTYGPMLWRAFQKYNSERDCADWTEPGSGQYAGIQVSDTGSGIAPEVQASIFEPFFTTKPSGHGTGLWLAMVRGIVRQHQGALQLETAPGRGTTFRILFPRAGTEASADAAQP